MSNPAPDKILLTFRDLEKVMENQDTLTVNVKSRILELTVTDDIDEQEEPRIHKSAKGKGRQLEENEEAKKTVVDDEDEDADMEEKEEDQMKVGASVSRGLSKSGGYREVSQYNFSL
jgi:hypothetical protein